MITLSTLNISGNEWKYVKEFLDMEWVSSAEKYVDLFEKKIYEYTCSKNPLENKIFIFNDDICGNYSIEN